MADSFYNPKAWHEDPPKGKYVYPANIRHDQDVNFHHVSKQPLEKKHLKSLDKRFQKEYNDYMND